MKVVEIIDGDRGKNYPKEKDFKDNGHTLFLSATNVTKNGFKFDSVQYITELKSNCMGNGKLCLDDIVLTSRGSLGNIAWYNLNIQRLVPFARINSGMLILRSKSIVSQCFLAQIIKSPLGQKQINFISFGSAQPQLTKKDISNFALKLPKYSKEQIVLGNFFNDLDNLITLHHRKYNVAKKGNARMIDTIKKTTLLHEYYAYWVHVYKEGAVRNVTMSKYYQTQLWLKKLCPDLIVSKLTRITYQKLLNNYAEFHERQTTMDFHHQLKAAILDAVDEGFILRDPTRKAIIKGRIPNKKKAKFLNQFELQTLLSNLDLNSEINWDWFILLVAKTGLRFSEALALTPNDFDFSHQQLNINKTWNYKENGGFMPTKNKSSVRKVQIDWQLVIQFSSLITKLEKDKPIFVKGNVYNSTINEILLRHCKKAQIPIISIHGLRHTHASLLLFAGVSIASVARRLGHSSMTTTQKTYLHIIQELENKDIDLVMRSLSGLVN